MKQNHVQNPQQTSTLNCFLNGRKAKLTFEEAHSRLWECSIGWVLPIHWLRHKTRQCEGQFGLNNVATRGALQFGFELMTRGYSLLSVEAFTERLRLDVPMSPSTFHARASRFARAFQIEPGCSEQAAREKYRPFEYVELLSPYYQPAYKMRDEVSWLIILDSIDGQMVSAKCNAIHSELESYNETINWDALKQPPDSRRQVESSDGH